MAGYIRPSLHLLDPRDFQYGPCVWIAGRELTPRAGAKKFDDNPVLQHLKAAVAGLDERVVRGECRAAYRVSTGPAFAKKNLCFPRRVPEVPEPALDKTLHTVVGSYFDPEAPARREAPPTARIRAV